ncbi:unnamed protein product, partial [Mesorhabditis spiculigera]
MGCVGYILFLTIAIVAVTVEAFCLANGECPPGHDCVDLHCVKQEPCHDRHDCPDFHVSVQPLCAAAPSLRCGAVQPGRALLPSPATPRNHVLRAECNTKIAAIGTSATWPTVVSPSR